jgi:hypothetical protein
MFDLEQAIKEWKKSLRMKNAIEDGDAAELEGYLRDKIEDLRGQGKSEEEAFKKAEFEDLGLNKDQIVNILLPEEIQARAEELKMERFGKPGIVSVAASYFLPSRESSYQTLN